jgi:phage terminase large subunit-like protein
LKIKVIDPKKHPNCFRGHKYAEDIVSGKIAACKYIIGSCSRYLKDLENLDAGWFFDADKAEKYLRSVQKLTHVIGNWKTKRILYEPWQCWLWMCVQGFRFRETGFRRFRVMHLEIGRGNAKSTMLSQLALYELSLDAPNGNQISTVATKKDQARIVLDASRAMARKNLSYLKHTGVKVLAHAISHPASNSVMRALASEHSGLDGLNDILAICDELHAMKRDTFEVISSGMSKRTDSLLACITTAGQDVHSVGHSQSTYAKKVSTGEMEDDQFFSAVYTLDEGDDWEDSKTWIKANPNLGVSVDVVTLQAKIDKATVTPADIPNIKIKHMNLWIAEAQAFYDQEVWDKCADPTLKLENFKGQPCRLGIDLASHIDITSIAIIFKKNDVYTLFDKSYIPEDTIRSAKNMLYDDCVAKGNLISTKGAAINYDFIRNEAEGLAKDFKILECGYDAWNATETAQKLSNKIEMVKVAMNVANLSEPMKKLDSLMRQGKIKHNGSPLLRWCLGNIVAKEDHNGNVFPRKSHTKLKIDPIIATLICLALWLQNQEVESVYETRGIRTL